MKRNLIRLGLAALLLNLSVLAMAQQPKSASKDTVNADKAAKPVFYQAAEEESSNGNSNSTLIGVVVGVLVAGGVVFLLRKKKK